MSKHKYLRVTAHRETLHRLPANWEEMRPVDRVDHIKADAVDIEDLHRMRRLDSEDLDYFFQEWTVSNESMHAAIPLWEICQKPEIILTLDGTYSKKDDFDWDEDTFNELFDE